jgi:hypothetical protein
LHGVNLACGPQAGRLAAATEKIFKHFHKLNLGFEIKNLYIYYCVCLLASLLVRAKISSANSLTNTNPLGLLSKQGYERSLIPDNKLGIKRYVL